ncbi:tetratricopeptide repeat protein [Spirosoma sp. HMF4905]|uniref:Tetratricopeptide repeat protein n=1 Tax=Spirosoma arboris TaxID=2682092 RepID=A0A7K1S676_9BACT|nr:tetratricopeptide repeat protein [Spirosoma arboris]MVM29230.1 tetratricopeptide repeat protein [Spirosoma arboris]
MHQVYDRTSYRLLIRRLGSLLKTPYLAFWLVFGISTSATAQVLTNTEQLSRQYPDSAYRLIKVMLDKAISQNDQQTEGDCLQQIGLLLYHQGSYVQAIDYLLQAQKIFHTTRDARRLARNHNELGTVYYYNEQVERALSQFKEALTFYRQNGNAEGLAQTYANIGHIYEKRQDPKQAYHYQKLALTNSLAANDVTSLTKIYENLGSIFEDEAQYDSAHFYYQNALALAQQTHDEIGQIEIINNLGDVFRKTGRYQQGLKFSREAMQRSQKTGELYQLSAALRDIAKTYRLVNQPDSAYSYLERSRDLVDAIYAADNTRQITLLQTLYDVERKDSEIAQLNAQKQIDFIIIIAASVVLVLIGILGAVIISRQRLKIRNEQAINQQNQQIFQTQNELMQVELKNQQLEEENLKGQLELKSKELTTHTLQIIQKNQVLEEIKEDLTAILKDDKRDQKKQLRQLVQKISLNFSQDKYWDDFRTIFDQVHPYFFTQLTQQFPDLTATDLRLIALLKMNISSADVATLLGISSDSLRVSRYRLRKKIGLAEGESLSAFIQRFPSQPLLSPENSTI